MGRLFDIVLTVVNAGRVLLVYRERSNCTLIMHRLGLSALDLWCLLKRLCSRSTVLLVSWVLTRLSCFSAHDYRAKRAR